MPIKLHIYATGPLDHGILADGIIKRTDDEIRPVSLRSSDRRVEVGDEIASAFVAKRIWTRCCESENRQGSYGRQYQLRHSFAWRRCHGEDALLGCGSAKRGQQTGDEA